jgi:2-amino-4-hydroxy-6-hydroxymethyldihydropteridine diphosphokinase
LARVYLGVGSNLEPEIQIPLGLKALSAMFPEMLESPWYRSSAVGFSGPDFINLVLAVDTDLSVGALSAQLKALEKDFGRASDAVKFSSRVLDVDILLYDDLVGEHEGVRLPRTDIQRFAFVLRPLLDIAPDVCCPRDGHRYADYWPAMANQSLVRLTPTDAAD